MKTFVIILILSLPFWAVPQCPQKGNNKSKSFQYMDSLKNRNITADHVDTIPLWKLLADGDDRKRFSNKQYIQTTGYVRYIMPGGPESCNCHTKDPKKFDLHIFLSPSLTDGIKSHMLIAEFTPYTFRQFPLFHTAIFQKSLIGKQVTITGWMFWDWLHFRNAGNTIQFSTKKGPVWRKTCWELHPITQLQILK